MAGFALAVVSCDEFLGINSDYLTLGLPMVDKPVFVGIELVLLGAFLSFASF